VNPCVGEFTMASTEPTGNAIGRPKKVKKVKGKSNPVGRPKGEAGIMKGYRDRMLNSPKSRKVLDSIFSAALDDDHKNQAAAWKIVVDRIVPVSGFEKVAGTNTRNAISINITGVPGVEIGGEASEDVVDEQ
jgi:hypothetical protein